MDNGVVRWFTLPPYETCGPLSQPRSDPKYLERVALKAVTIWIPRTHFKQRCFLAASVDAWARLSAPNKRARILANAPDSWPVGDPPAL